MGLPVFLTRGSSRRKQQSRLSPSLFARSEHSLRMLKKEDFSPPNPGVPRLVVSLARPQRAITDDSSKLARYFLKDGG